METANSLINIRYLGPGVIAASFLILFLLELLLPLRQRKRPLAGRLITNLGFAVLTFILGAYIVKPAAFGIMPLVSQYSFGLLHLVKLPLTWQFVFGFLLMDVSFYYWHRANHVFGFFWRFHKIHHIDPDLDVSTAFRFHFGEILYSTGFRVVQAGLIGVSPMIYTIYELFFQMATIFHHSNLHLPIRIERRLNKILVTPRMHGIHHSVIRAETDSNYSTIFRWWDDLHKTLRLNVPQKEIDIGVAGYQKPKDNDLANLLMLPFRKQIKPTYPLDKRYLRREPPKAEANPKFLLE